MQGCPYKCGGKFHPRGLRNHKKQCPQRPIEEPYIQETRENRMQARQGIFPVMDELFDGCTHSFLLRFCGCLCISVCCLLAGMFILGLLLEGIEWIKGELSIASIMLFPCTCLWYVVKNFWKQAVYKTKQKKEDLKTYSKERAKYDLEGGVKPLLKAEPESQSWLELTTTAIGYLMATGDEDFIVYPDAEYEPKDAKMVQVLEGLAVKVGAAEVNETTGQVIFKSIEL